MMFRFLVEKAEQIKLANIISAEGTNRQIFSINYLNWGRGTIATF
jgi:hypothetical protein